MTTNKETLPVPCVHNNGTGMDSLVKQAQDAYLALDAAQDLMAQARPHGRDYYPLGDDAYVKARDAHNELYRLVDSIKHQYAALGYAIQKAGK